MKTYIAPINNNTPLEELVTIGRQNIGKCYENLLREELSKVISHDYLGWSAHIQHKNKIIKSAKPIGYAVVKPTIETFHLETIAVDYAYRSQGIGAKILTQICQDILHFAKDNHETPTILNVVTDSDANKTINFYLKQGFEISGYVKDEFVVGTNQVHLRKVLS